LRNRQPARVETPRPRFGKVIEAIGAEVIEILDDRIKEIRDYHRRLSAKAA
jgi:hypothetical protein